MAIEHCYILDRQPGWSAVSIGDSIMSGRVSAGCVTQMLLAGDRRGRVGVVAAVRPEP